MYGHRILTKLYLMDKPGVQLLHHKWEADILQKSSLCQGYRDIAVMNNNGVLIPFD